MKKEYNIRFLLTEQWKIIIIKNNIKDNNRIIIKILAEFNLIDINFWNVLFNNEQVKKDIIKEHWKDLLNIIKNFFVKNIIDNHECIFNNFIISILENSWVNFPNEYKKIKYKISWLWIINKKIFFWFFNKKWEKEYIVIKLPWFFSWKSNYLWKNVLEQIS